MYQLKEIQKERNARKNDLRWKVRDAGGRKEQQKYVYKSKWVLTIQNEMCLMWNIYIKWKHDSSELGAYVELKCLQAFANVYERTLVNW